MKRMFAGRVLLLGQGPLASCTATLILRHFRISAAQVTVLDLEPNGPRLAMSPCPISQVHARISPESMASVLANHVGPGDLIIDLTARIDCVDILQWCHDNGVMYVSRTLGQWPADERTTYYARHLAIRARVNSWLDPFGPTAILAHGGSSGLGGHFVKLGLRALAQALLGRDPRDPRREEVATSLATENYPFLARTTGTRVIHMIEHPARQTEEFCLCEERDERGLITELGWGTHEARLPLGAEAPEFGPGNEIWFTQQTRPTWVRTWLMGQEVSGLLLCGPEAFSTSDYLTVWEDEQAAWRPTVCRVCCPLPTIPQGSPVPSSTSALGALLMGHDFQAWWTGALLTEAEAGRLVPGHAAATVQEAIALIAAAVWAFDHPGVGVGFPDDLPHEEILAVARPYLGAMISQAVDWTPRKERDSGESRWQFELFAA